MLITFGATPPLSKGIFVLLWTRWRRTAAKTKALSRTRRTQHRSAAKRSRLAFLEPLEDRRLLAPVAFPDGYGPREDTPFVLAAPGVLTNDTGATFAILDQLPTRGTLDFNANGGFTYTPTANLFGTDTFTYRASDGPTNSAITTVTLEVSAVNDPPTIAAISNPTAVREDIGQQTVNFSGVGAGGNETQTLTITAVSSNPTLIPNPAVTYTSPNASGSLSYTPAPNQSGTATITVTVTDNGGTADGGVNQFQRSFTVSVTAVNDAPTLDAIDNPAPILEDAGTQNFSLTGISAGPVETQTLTVTATSSNTALIPNPTITYSSPNATGNLAFAPVANQSGEAVITVRVQDNGGTANSGVNFITRSFTVSVTPVNDPPTPSGESYSTTQNQPLFANAPGVLANDKDLEGSPLTAILVSGPSQGLLNLNADGSFVYLPPTGFTGNTSFTYRARDGQDNSATTATVAITVAAVAAPATVSGALWNDENGDRVKNAAELAISGGTVFADLNNNGGRDTIGSLEPDQFAAGTALTSVSSRVTLTAVDAALVPLAGAVTAIPGGGAAATGTHVFGNAAGPAFHQSQRLKLTFTSPVDRLSLDFVGGNSGGTERGRLEIYNAANRLLNTYLTQPLAAGVVERMTLVSGQTDIAYAIAYTDAPNGNGRLDNLSFSLNEPFVVSAADGSYSLANLAAGSAVIRRELPTGFRVTSPQVSDRHLFAIDTSASPNRIVEINPLTGAVIRSIAIPAGLSFGDLGLATDGKTMFLTADQTKTLYELDAASGTVLDSFSVATGSYQSNLGVLDGKVYMLDWVSGVVTTIDPVSNTISPGLNWENINNGFFFDDTLGESVATGELVTTTSDYVAFVNPTTGVRSGSIGTSGGFSSITAVQVIGDEVYVAYSFPNKIEVFSRASGALLRTLTLAFAVGELAGVGDTSGAQRVNLTAGQAAANIDFGSQSTFGTIRGQKWRDLNGNGTREAGETPLAGQIIYLDQNNNRTRDANEPTAVTDAEGNYVFANVLPGQQVVRADVPAPFEQSFPFAAANIRDRLFVSDVFQDKILELNPQTGATVNSFAAPFDGSITDGLAFDGRTLYYLNDSNDILYELNPDTGAVLDSTIMPSSSYEGLAALGGLVYVGHSFDGRISVFDPVSDVVLRTISVTGFPNSSLYDGLGELPEADRLLARGLFGEIIEVNPLTGAASVTFTAQISNPYGLAGMGQEIFVGDSSGTIHVYSRAGALLRSFTNVPDVFSLAAGKTPDGGHRVNLGIAATLTNLNFGTNETVSLAAADDTATTAEDTELTVSVPGVLFNDTGSGPTAVLDSNPTKGTVTLLPTGGYTYRPHPDAIGFDSFRYHATDGVTSSSSATVVITITSVNDPPSGGHDTLSEIDEDSGPRTISFATLLANDSPGPANEATQQLTIVHVSSPTLGSVNVDSVNQTVIFVPTADANGEASFVYTVRDNGQTGQADDFQSATATVSFLIDAVNDPPRFSKGPNPTTTDVSGPESLAGWATGIAAGPADEAAQELHFEVNVPPDQEELFTAVPTLDVNGALQFTAAPNAFGTVITSAVLVDRGGIGGAFHFSEVQTFTITITKPQPRHNVIRGLDVVASVSRPDGKPDGIVTPADALAIINYINAFGSGTNGGAAPLYHYYDTAGGENGRGDNMVTSADVLAVVNHINAFGSGTPGPAGEGESNDGEFGEGESSSDGSIDSASGDLLALLADDVCLATARRRRI